MTTAALHTFIESLTKGDLEAMVALFDEEVDIDLPECGRQIGTWGAAAAVEGYTDLFSSIVEITPINEIATTVRSVVEVAVTLADQANPLTFAVVGEHSHGALQRVRGYHAMRHYKGYYTARPQMIDIPAKRPVLPEVVAHYFDAVHHHPDLDRAVGLYSDNAALVAPPGNRAEGRDALRFIYSLFLESGGIALHHCAATDDGQSVAIEWACDRWGASVFPDLEAGCAVYDYSDGQLHGARIYDDLNPPFETQR